jgi:hypothetical protein
VSESCGDGDCLLVSNTTGYLTNTKPNSQEHIDLGIDLLIKWVYLNTELDIVMCQCISRCVGIRHWGITTLTHCGRVTQICVFNTVKLSTSASSP